MNRNNFLFVIFSFIAVVCTNVMAEVNFKQLDNGWFGLTEQIDPFDSSAVKVIQISKGEFTFKCGQLNMDAASYGYESLSFGAEIKYIVDEKAAKSKTGYYSTYLGGSDMMTDSRYYSFKMDEDDINSMKHGSKMKVAGKYGRSGWETKSIDLIGFTSAYSLMCGK